MMGQNDGEARFNFEKSQYTTLELMQKISEKHFEIGARAEAIEISRDRLSEIDPSDQEALTSAQMALEKLVEKQTAEELDYKSMLQAYDNVYLLNNGELPN